MQTPESDTYRLTYRSVDGEILTATFPADWTLDLIREYAAQEVSGFYAGISIARKAGR